jgi:protein O-GlcNAc transferase
MKMVGRNDPCPCGSGKKYKQCCNRIEKKSISRSESTESRSENNMMQVALSQMRSGDYFQVEMICQQVLAINPKNYEALNCLGFAALQVGDPSKALRLIQAAVEINPEVAEFHNNLGRANYVLGKMQDAVENYKQAVLLRADYPEAYNNMGNAFRYQGLSDEAIKSFEKAIRLSPQFAAAYNNLGIVYKDQGRLEDAIACYRKALLIKPGTDIYYSNLLFCLSIYNRATSKDYLAVALEYGRVMTEKVKPFVWDDLKKTENVAHKSLRIGFVSGDFRMHPVGYFLEAILKHLSPDGVELYAYSTVLKEDVLTERIKPLFKKWQVLVGMRSDIAAQHIYDEQLDCLIDLSGHSSTNSLNIFAFKPAPLQISWLGYWASTGMPTIDYILVDRLSVPPENCKNFTEKIVYLPDTRLCFTPPSAPDEFLPAELPALAKGFVTFGSFQNMSKITNEVLMLWAKIFVSLPDARLRIQNKQMNSSSMREIFFERLAQAGIGREKVLLVGSMPREEYLAAYADVDMILDTFPFSGGTTTCEALWMGVPTLTLAGNTMVARQGVSIMTNVDMPDWVAVTDKDYVEKACSYSCDLSRLSEIRMSLRQQASHSSLFDACRFSSNFEKTLKALWRSHHHLQ